MYEKTHEKMERIWKGDTWDHSQPDDGAGVDTDAGDEQDSASS